MTERYVPAAGRFGSTRLYDRTVAVTMNEARWRPRLVRSVTSGLNAGARIVDLGAGTGTLALALAAARPDAQVIAIDGDPEALAIARAKPGAADVEWREGLAGQLDLPDASVDAGVMSLVLHHLSPTAKRAALSDVARVLRPGSTLHIADWGRPATPLLRASFFVLSVIDGPANTRELGVGRLPTIIGESGFAKVDRLARIPTAWGTLELLRGTQPLVSAARASTKPG